MLVIVPPSAGPTATRTLPWRAFTAHAEKLECMHFDVKLQACVAGELDRLYHSLTQQQVLQRTKKRAAVQEYLIASPCQCFGGVSPSIRPTTPSWLMT